ncbi:MAG: hypothetical protein HAW67_00025, partial [Endozoicomonadaceae bacterium]|nr:hypothetical protein [Endozoicomonadaceae bacterium]
MSRDGSDCDWLNENGYDFLVTGDIPSGWGDDDERKYEPKSKIVFTEYKSQVDEEQLLSDIRDVILKDKNNAFSFYYTNEAEKYYIANS